MNRCIVCGNELTRVETRDRSHQCPITTLAALKRYLQVGVRFRCIHNYKGPVDAERVVSRVQGNGLWFKGSEYGEREGWLSWPAAKDVTFTGRRVRFTTADPTRYVEYDLEAP